VIFVPSNYPPGTVAIARGELARYTDFEDSLDRVQVPVGTDIVRAKGSSVARNRNNIVSDHFKVGEWLCFIDDDQVIPPDTILKLLSHNKPIVGALYSSKQPPYVSMSFKSRREDGKYIPWLWKELASLPRLQPCAATGTGCMVIQRSVFAKLTSPFFHAAEYTDDLYFCQNAIQAGFTPYVDQEAVIGHTTTHNVWPDLSVPGARLEMMWFNVQIPDDSQEGINE
jgi:hypothetical protein